MRVELLYLQTLQCFQPGLATYDSQLELDRNNVMYISTQEFADFSALRRSVGVSPLSQKAYPRLHTTSTEADLVSYTWKPATGRYS